MLDILTTYTSTNSNLEETNTFTYDKLLEIKDRMLIAQLADTGISYIINPYVEKPIVFLPERFDKLITKESNKKE